MEDVRTAYRLLARLARATQ